jgi:glycosyltransferase involved in cell wall biosynthesis
VYLENLCAQLAAQGDVEVVEATNERRATPAGGGVGSAVNAAADVYWSEVELPRLARRAQADVIHHALPARAHGARIPQVVTVHDLAFEALPGLFDSRFRTYAHLTHRQAAVAADVVIAVSHATAGEIRERWRVPSNRIVVAPHGPGQPLPKVPARPREHLLYVGDAEPRKDLGTLLSAYAAYRAGGGSAAAPRVIAGSAQVPPQDGISFERDVDAERLAELYAGAVALVHPALYEGFGLTVLEAMGAGVPVVAAGSVAIAEIGAHALRMYTPGDVEELTDALTVITSDSDEQERLAAAGAVRAAQFSWSACATAHAAAYAQAVESRGGRPRVTR